MTVDTPPPALSPLPPRAAPRRRRRWLVLIAGASILMVLAVWLAPAVVARTPLRNRLVQRATADLRGTVTVGGASLGWFSPVELRDVTVTDSTGRTLLAAPKITSSKSLAALIRNRADLGEFTVERPALEVVGEKQSTNLEDALANYLLDDAASSGPERTAVALHVVDGTVRIHDADAQKSWELDSVNATVRVPRSRAEAVAVTVDAKCAGGSLDADLALGASGKAVVNATAFPLESLALAVRRGEPGASLGGRLTTHLTADWSAGESAATKLSLDGTVSIKEFALAGPWLNGDRLQLASVDLPLKLAKHGESIAVERAELTCDVGTLNLAGTFDPDVPFDRLLDQPGMNFAADIDLAKLAALLPRLLRIRPGTAITDGRLAFKLGSASTPTGTAWTGAVRTSALKATRDGKPLEWKEPLSVEFVGRFPPGQMPLFDRLVCRSDFIAINAKCEPDSLKAAANVYLDVLSERLAEFVDIGGFRIGGTAAARLIASRTPQGHFSARLDLDLTKFHFADRNGLGFREDAIALRFTADGSAIPQGPIRVNAAVLQLVIGTDELHLALNGPMPDVRQFFSAGFNARLTGDFGRWMGRVRGVARVPAHYAFAGQMSASGIIRLSREQLNIDRLTLALDRVQFRGAGLDLDEPSMTASANMTLVWATAATSFENFHIRSAPLSVAGGKLAFETQPNGLLASFGGGPATTDLARLGKTLKISSDPAGANALRGTGVGPIHFRNLGSTTTFNGTLDIKDFGYGRPADTGIAEPTLRLELDGFYTDTTDTVTLSKAVVARPGLTIDGKGSLGKFDTTQEVALDGNLTYDLVKLTPDFRVAVGGGFDAVGKGTRPFSVAGSLAPGGLSVHVGKPKGPFAGMAASAAVGWDSVKAYGFEMGPSELTAKLTNGTMHVSPLRAAFAGSTIALTPTVRLDPMPSELTFAKGRIVDRARLTPQILAGGMGYVLPAIANATQVEGEVSMVLGDNRIPLADFSKATVKGELHIHKATVSAGPVVTELAKQLGGPATQLTLANEMIVPVRIENGRVFHENFTLNFNGVVVKTSGSVGFDGSLALVADVPVPTAAFQNNPRLMQALRGKRIPLPIGGTVSKPVIDPRQFQAAIGKLAQDSVKDIGRDLLNKELEKVFPLKK